MYTEMQSPKEIHSPFLKHKHTPLIPKTSYFCSLNAFHHPFASASSGELGLEIWQREMIRPLQKRLVGVLLMGIQQDRTAAATDAPTSTIRGVIHSFVDVNMYKKKSTLQVGIRLCVYVRPCVNFSCFLFLYVSYFFFFFYVIFYFFNDCLVFSFMHFFLFSPYS